MSPLTAQTIVHLIGFMTGLMLFLILLSLVMKNQVSWWSWSSAEAAPPQSLILIAAVIGVVWNFGALIVYGARDLGLGSVPRFFEAAIFSSLGYLPAVVVHFALSSESGLMLRRGARLMIGIAYGLSMVATLLHLRAALIGDEPHSVKGLEILTIGFGVLTIGLLVYPRRSSLWKRMIWLVALSFYAVSALHLSRHIGGEDPWFVELIGHHSSLPLVWAMLYRDYRFALADIFLKRVLAVILLLGLVFGLSLLLVVPFVGMRELQNFIPFPAGLALLAIWFTTTLAFPRLRRSMDWLVDAVILQREDYQILKDDLARLLESSEEVPEILNQVCQRLQQSFTASEVEWEIDEDLVAGRSLVVKEGRRTTIFLPTQERPHYRLIIGELSGGRQFLSDDLALLESVALNLVRRLDAVRMIEERYARSLREQEMSKLATEAELRALRAQLNPHFLFNALTTIGYLIQSEPERAVETLLKLTGVLRAVLRAPTAELVTLGDEIELIESYLAVERARFEERLQVDIDVPPNLLKLRLPALLLQPLVENAIKHGISPSLRGGELRIVARIDATPGDERLCLEVRDTGVGVDHNPESASEESAGGLGLCNVRRRMKGIYGERARLDFSSRPGEGTAVTLWLPLDSEVSSI